MLLMSCDSEDKPSNTGSGSINFKLKVDAGVVSTADASGNVAINPVSPELEDFNIRLSSEDGSYSKEWGSFADFPSNEQFRVGTYLVEAYYGSINGEGFDKPYYYGSSRFTVSDADVSDVSVTCSLANTMVSIDYTDAFKEYFADYSTTLHSEGGIHFVYGKEDTRPAYLRPGNITMSLSLTMPGGLVATFQPAVMKNTLARHHYHIMMDVNRGNIGVAQLVISFDDKLLNEDFIIELSDELINSPAPEITSEGFVSGEAVAVVEGQSPDYPVKMEINTQAGLSSVILTTSASSLIADGWPLEIDLMNISVIEQAMIEGMGLKTEGLWDNSSKMAVLDFTGLLGRLRSDAAMPVAAFTVVAKDKLTKISEPVTLSVDIIPVKVTIESKSDVLIGDNTAEIVIGCEGFHIMNNLILETCNDNGIWENLAVTSVDEVQDKPGHYVVKFNVPEGITDIPLRIKYLGTVKAETVLERQSPRFSIEADAFAHKAVVKILSDDNSLLPLLTRYLSVYADNVKCTVISRDEDAGTVTVTGLNPSASYRVKATVMEGNATPTYSNAVDIYTEAVIGIPNGDFEDIDDMIDYEELFSGGRYSTSTVAIMNRQNRVTLDVDFPKDWASVNSKTFCESATNHNTWYMQPSAMIVADKQSGTKAMKIASVAWDVNGMAIADYIQEGTPYVGYNRNVPEISYRAAGKLFLGEYRFDATTLSETYNEGIGFQSRPSALNGYFKYVPSAVDYNDKGLVAVTVIGLVDGKEVEIANEKMLLSAASGYTAFSLPIRYGMFGVKAIRIQVMIASSSTIGTIEFETSEIKTSPDCVSASSIGSVLWIDNISFSY